MRKSYIICAALLIVSLTAGLLVSAAATAPIDDVEVELRCIKGDASAAEGLVLYNIHSYNTLYWRSRVALGTQPEIASDFRIFNEMGLSTDKAKEWLATSLAGGQEAWLDWDREEKQELTVAEKEMQLEENTFHEGLRLHIETELAAQVKRGPAQTFVVQVADYCDHYTYRIFENGYYRWYYDANDPVALELQYCDDLIRRPVEEGHCIAVTIGLGAEGEPDYISWDDNYYFNQYYEQEMAVNQSGAANTESQTPPEKPAIYGFDGVYLESAAAANGTFVIIEMVEGLRQQATAEWFPRGYGLFYVPWEDYTFEHYSYYVNGEAISTVSVPRYDKMELVCPMTWGEERLVDLTATPDGRSVQMVTRDGEGMWLTSIADGGEVLQRQRLPEEIRAEEGLTISAYDEFLTVMDDAGEFAVYSLSESGAAVFDFRGAAGTPGEGSVYWNMQMARYNSQELAYNGERLAVTGGGWVQVYDKTGLLYTGYCDLSVEQQGVGLYSHPPQLRWES